MYITKEAENLMIQIKHEKTDSIKLRLMGELLAEMVQTHLQSRSLINGLSECSLTPKERLDEAQRIIKMIDGPYDFSHIELTFITQNGGCRLLLSKATLLAPRYQG